MNQASQKADILRALVSGQTLTPLDALELFGCLRLGARIWDLRQEGHRITSRLVQTETGKHVAEYALEEDTGTTGFRKFIPGRTERTPDGLSRDVEEVTWGGRR